MKFVNNYKTDYIVYYGQNDSKWEIFPVSQSGLRQAKKLAKKYNSAIEQRVYVAWGYKK